MWGGGGRILLQLGVKKSPEAAGRNIQANKTEGMILPEKKDCTTTNLNIKIIFFLAMASHLSASLNVMFCISC